MGSWKLGYANNLDSVANEEAGIALYDPWSVEAITLSTNTDIERLGGKVVSVSGQTLTDTGNFTTDQFNGGFCKILSGTAKGIVYKITDTTTDTIVLEDDAGAAATLATDGVATDDYYEVVTGSPTFVFPEDRNPSREDIKRTSKGIYQRFAFYDGGLAISEGSEPDDMVVFATVTSEASLAQLKILAGLKIDYEGFDGTYSTGDLAPLILETGTHDADHQFLVHINDVKRVRDGGRGSGLIDVTIHMTQINLVSYRGC